MKQRKNWTTQEREMLFRKTQGKIMRGAYLEKLSHFFISTPQASHLLGLAETDEVIKKPRIVLQEQGYISDKRAEMLSLYPGWAYKSQRQMLAFAQSLIQRQHCYLYWYDDSHCCGIYQTDSDTRINLDYDFTLHKPDDIWLYAKDDRFSLHLEYLHDEVF